MCRVRKSSPEDREPGGDAGDHRADVFTIDTVFLQTLYVIVVIELGSRRLLHANCTANPDFHWMTQQALNVVYELQDQPVPVRFALRDRDAKFTSSFDAVLEAEGIKVIRTPYRAPLASHRFCPQRVLRLRDRGRRKPFAATTRPPA